MNILAISGSLRKGSYNTAIVHALKKQESDRISIDIYEGLGKLPFFNADLDDHTLQRDNSPSEVKALRQKVTRADALLISTPEYAFQIPGVLKNGLDWLVSSSAIIDKPVIIITASTSGMGGNKAHESLTQLMNVISGKVVNNAGLQVAKVNKKIGTDGTVTDPELKNDLRKVLVELDNYLSAYESH